MYTMFTRSKYAKQSHQKWTQMTKMTCLFGCHVQTPRGHGMACGPLCSPCDCASMDTLNVENGCRHVDLDQEMWCEKQGAEGWDRKRYRVTQQGSSSITGWTTIMYNICKDAQFNYLSNSMSVNAWCYTHVDMWPKESFRNWAKPVTGDQNAKNVQGSSIMTTWHDCAKLDIFWIPVTSSIQISYLPSGRLPWVQARLLDVC